MTDYSSMTHLNLPSYVLVLHLKVTSLFLLLSLYPLGQLSCYRSVPFLSETINQAFNKDPKICNCVLASLLPM